MSRAFDIGDQKPFLPPRRSFTEIDRDEIVRQTLDEAMRRLHSLHGNPTYRRAFEISAKVLQRMKP
jgi:hypothetical protein